MSVISTSWSCKRCGGVFISTPPEHGLCRDCLRDEPCTCAQPRTVNVCPDAIPTCDACGGPVCPDCGQRLMLLIPVAASADAESVWEVSSDDR